MKTIVGITGTTSVGKSAVAVQLAKMLGTEIISADSMQVYRGMNIGTAKITAAEQQGVVHHMLDVAYPNENFSAFLFREKAAEIIDRMQTVPIVVGGTGFYFDCLLYPPEYGNATEARHKELLKLFRQEGLEHIVELLRKIDPSACDTVDTHNYKRVLRAIEIAESGASRSRGTTRLSPRYNILLFVLERNRTELYEQIDNRVDEMVRNGLVQEVEELVRKYGICDAPAFEAIGYKEIIGYLQGRCTLQEATEQVKINSRHYAKKQISYYKRMNVTAHIDVSNRTADDVAKEIFDKIKS